MVKPRLPPKVAELLAKVGTVLSGGGAPLFPQTVRFTDRIFSMLALRLVLWVFVASITHEGIFTDPFNIADWMDDHQFVSWEESDRMTFLRFHQLPAWNPYWCGGSVGIVAPEDPFLSPDFFLRLIFGVAHGRRLTILLLVMLGFEGTYRLCRRLDASCIGATFAALVYGATDRFVGFIHDGWIHFLGFELIPWVILGLLAGMTSWRWRLVGAFFFAWIVMAPGTYPTPFTLITFAYLSVAFCLYGLLKRRPPDDALGLAWWQRPWVAVWISGVTLGVVALGITFGKLVPTLMWVRQFARTFVVVETHDPSQVFSGMWVHYGVVLFIALIGVITADVAAAIFAGGALLAFTLACGDYGPHSPFHLMKILPIVGQLRYPDRYMVIFTFFIAVAASRGITRLEDAVPALVRRFWEAIYWARRRTAPPMPHILHWLAVGAAAYLAFHQMKPLTIEVLEPMRIRAHAMYPEPPARTYDQPFRQHRGNRRDGHIFPPMNMGSLYCAVGNPLPESPLLRADLAQEEYPVDPTKATVKRLMWSPEAIDLEVDAKEPTTIYVNQNWAPQWTTSVGQVKSVDKLLAVDVPAGLHVVHLEYKDRFLLGCIAVSILTLLAIAFTFGRDAYRLARREWVAFDKMPWWPSEEPAEDDATSKEKPADTTARAGEAGSDQADDTPSDDPEEPPKDPASDA